ncbi:MAG: hypothetical protein F6J96_24245 [Symploca sp. SIO1C2]|nr:hypothetical protein [Symploca sp. SIO1C2]
MKRFLTLLMAAILVAMAAFNVNVPEAAAAPTATECQKLISYHPFLKENPYFMKDCGPYLNTTAAQNTTAVQIVDIDLVDYCTYEVEYKPKALEDPYFKDECSDALKSAKVCHEYLIVGSKSSFNQIDPKVDLNQFADYCHELDYFGILERNSYN